MSRTRPTTNTARPGIVWVRPAGGRVYGVAARESLFDAIQLRTHDLVEAGDSSVLRLLVLGLKAGGVVRIDNDPPVVDQ